MMTDQEVAHSPIIRSETQYYISSFEDGQTLFLLRLAQPILLQKLLAEYATTSSYVTLFTLSKNIRRQPLQTSLLRALAPTTPTYLFPAMNTLMYEHPLTAHHLNTIKEVIGYNIVGPIGKQLACGDIGIGAMTEWTEIVAIVVEKFGLDLKE